VVAKGEAELRKLRHEKWKRADGVEEGYGRAGDRPVEKAPQKEAGSDDCGEPRRPTRDP
jgi:hypothetical protein